MPFANFTDFLKDVSGQGQTLFAKVKDKKTFNRMVSACYLIANADDNFSDEEKQATAALIKKQLPQYDIKDIVSALSAAEEKVGFDKTFGNAEIMDEIAKATEEEAETIIRAAVFIGSSDGDFDDAEKDITRNLCSRMEINPANYGL